MTAQECTWMLEGAEGPVVGLLQAWAAVDLESEHPELIRAILWAQQIAVVCRLRNSWRLRQGVHQGQGWQGVRGGGRERAAWTAGRPRGGGIQIAMGGGKRAARSSAPNRTTW
jgi:hypothetical protein